MKRTITITDEQRLQGRCLAVSEAGKTHWSYIGAAIFDCNYSGQRRTPRVRQTINTTVTLDEKGSLQTLLSNAKRCLTT